MSEIKPDVNKKVNQLREMDARDRWRLIGNWLLDHAMIIIILLMVIYIQIQRPAFLATASIVNIIQLTATRLPIALGIAGAIILTGTDLSAGRVVGLGAFVSAILLQKSDLANRFLAGMGPWPVVIVLVVVMAVGGIVGLVNGFCVAKFKLHPFIVTLSTQLITYGLYLTLSNAAQISNLDASYTSDSRALRAHVPPGQHPGDELCGLCHHRNGHHVVHLEQDHLRQEHVRRRFQ